MMITKEDLVKAIASRLEVETPPMSTGSTEPREIFDLVNKVLGLGLDASLTKPEMARSIVESTGMPWNADFESRGGTVTKKGIEAVLNAVIFYVGD